MSCIHITKQEVRGSGDPITFGSYYDVITFYLHCFERVVTFILSTTSEHYFYCLCSVHALSIILHIIILNSCKSCNYSYVHIYT